MSHDCDVAPNAHCADCRARAGVPIHGHGSFRPVAWTGYCGSCGHKLSEHDANDGGRCYHEGRGEFTCDCEGAA